MKTIQISSEKSFLMTPWGRAHSVKKLAPGIYEVETDSHGGILIKQNQVRHVLSQKAIAIGVQWGKWLVFEEDCDLFAILFEHPEFYDMQDKINVKYMAQKSLQHWHPEYFKN